MNRTVPIAIAAALAACFASPAGAQDIVTQIVERADGGVEVVLPDGDVQVLEPGVVNTLQSGLASLAERAGRVGGTPAATGAQTAETQSAAGEEAGAGAGEASAGAAPEAGAGSPAEQAETIDAEVEYGTSQPNFNVSLGNELTYSAAARVGDAGAAAGGGPQATVQDGAGPGIAATGAAPAQGNPDAPGDPTLEGLAELVEDTVAELDESADGSPTNAPAN